MINNSELKSKNEALLSEILKFIQYNQETLNQILIWLKISGTEKVKILLNSTLDSDSKKIVYNLSDGKTSREINSICGVAPGTISIYWNSWFRLGLMEIKIIKGTKKYFKNFNIEDFGIEVPNIPQKEQPPKSKIPSLENSGSDKS
jgi:hypothetical protein